jgi:Family of unknown function (DUF5995)
MDRLTEPGPPSPSHPELVAKLRAIVERLSSYTVRYDKLRDSRAVFTYTYKVMTSILADELEKQRWQDEAWIVALAEAFSARYFNALDAYDRGVRDAGAWTGVFDTITSERSSVLEDMVAGMIGHIVHDLPLGIVDVGMTDPSGITAVGDYDGMNTVLGNAIDSIFRHVTRRYNPVLHGLEDLVKGNHDLLNDYGIRMSRGLAWYNAVRVESPSREAALASLERSPLAALRELFKPTFWAADLALRAFRFITSLGRRWPRHALRQPSHGVDPLANRTYYLHVGVGNWTGAFTFALTDFRAFRAARLGFVDRFLVLSMAALMAVVRRAKISSVLESFPDQGAAGTVINDVRVTLAGIPLYTLSEEYVLSGDGAEVFVNSRERFGPIPFLFNRRKRHPAVVDQGGMHATYFIPLLGDNWIGDYHVHPDGNHINSKLTCPWAEATEEIERVAVSQH